MIDDGWQPELLLSKARSRFRIESTDVDHAEWNMPSLRHAGG
jgi:hypothetical protein